MIFQGLIESINSNEESESSEAKAGDNEDNLEEDSADSEIQLKPSVHGAKTPKKMGESDKKKLVIFSFVFP